MIYKTAFLLLALSGLTPIKADISGTQEIPFVRYDCLHRLLGGSWSEVWTSKWPDADKALYDESIRREVEKDFRTTLQSSSSYFKPWTLPLKLDAVKRNPRNGLIYFLFSPANSDMEMDGNVVYVYDPQTKWWICKTTVDLGF